MWLGNDTLKVFFDEKRGGMPVADSFGILRAVSVEIARTRPFPYFQSLNEKKPHIKVDGSEIRVKGVMQKSGEVLPHTFELDAAIEENRLSLDYRLNVAADSRIVESKIWLWTKPFQSYAVDAAKFDIRSKTSIARFRKQGGTWHLLEERLGQPALIRLFGNSSLSVSGSTTPPYYSEIYRYEYEKLEVVYGWAKAILKKGVYSGSLVLTYDR
jgi:hypothetical protein